jgi:Tol biopolymer transport system component
MVVGTVAYMSPEQAQGKAIDTRSDVFTFGVMLYEMATGTKPFQGESTTSTLAKILETEPVSVTELRSDLPPELARIIRRCLRKRPEDRYNDTRDLAVALRDLVHESSSGAIRKAETPASVPAVAESPPAPPVQPPREKTRPKDRTRFLGWAAAVVVLVLVAVAAAVWVPKLIPPSRPSGAPPSFRQLTFTGSALYPALSPDGQSIAYVTGGEGDHRIMIQDLGGGQPLEIFQAAWIRSLRWSPSGSELLLSGSSTDDVTRTFLVPRLGGGSRPLRYFPFVAWSPDGNRFAGTSLPAKDIWFIDTTTGGTTSIALSGSFLWLYEVDWSATGRLLAFRTSDEKDRHAIWTTTSDGSQQQVVVQQAAGLYSPRFSPAGDAIYYLSQGEQARDLWKAPVDPGTGEAAGEPVLLLSGLQAGDHMTLSSDGTRLVYTREVSHSNLWLVEREEAGDSPKTKRLTTGTLWHGAPRFSPDGRSVALTRGSRSKTDIFILSLEDREIEQLTFLGADSWQPVWSPDGREIAFGSTQGGAPQVWSVGSRGGTPRPFEKTSLSKDLAWAPGSRILYQRPGDSGFHFLDAKSEEETPFAADDAGGMSASDPLQFFSWMFSPRYSPDGARVAVKCQCPDGEGIWVHSVRGSSRILVYKDPQALPTGWSADGAWVFAFEPEERRIVRIPATGGPAETLLTLPLERVEGVDVTPDARRVVSSVPEIQADIWQVENFDPESN